MTHAADTAATAFMFLFIGGVAVAVIVGIVLFVINKDFKIDVGAPTPQQRDTLLNSATAAAVADTEAKAKGVKNASLDEKIATASGYAARGKLPK